MNLNINYDDIRNIGNQMIAKSDEFRTLLNKINNVNGNVASVWAGTDAAKYSDAVAQQAQVMAQLASVIAEIGDYLIRVGNAYQRTSENNASAIH